MQLKAKGINFKYKDDKYILKDIDFTIDSGEVVGLIAPSGFGKTTLAKILAGYEKPQSGSVTIEGNKLSKKGYSPVQLIFQHPEKSVNPKWKMDKILKEAFEPSKELLEDMGIKKEWLKRWPSELSGGELQRVSIARALCKNPKLMLCDEPTGALDSETGRKILTLLYSMSKEYNNTVIVVTHNAAIAPAADRVIKLKDGKLDEIIDNKNPISMGKVVW